MLLQLYDYVENIKNAIRHGIEGLGEVAWHDKEGM